MYVVCYSIVIQDRVMFKVRKKLDISKVEEPQNFPFTLQNVVLHIYIYISFRPGGLCKMENSYSMVNILLI